MAIKRILAVENNALVLSFLEAGLTTAGYDVDTATNGREALEMIDRLTSGNETLATTWRAAGDSVT